MIRTLRRKFIAIAMGSMVLVLSILIAGMNIINYRNMISDLNMRLDVLSMNAGNFPTQPSQKPDYKPDYPVQNAENAKFDTKDSIYDDYENYEIKFIQTSSPQDDFKFDNDINKKRHNDISQEAPFDTRYFTVTLKNDTTLVSVNTGKIATVSTTKAIEYATELFLANKTEGFFNDYKYRMISVEGSNEDESNIMYIFLYCGREIHSFRNSLLSSIIVSIIGILLVFILVVFFSKLLVKPVAESYDKQKRFITDASHELKTPLTIIEANTEVLEMMEGENEWTQSIHNQVKRLTSLTQKLVFLSRMDEGNANTLTMLDFSLSDAVEETATPFDTVATTNNKKLTLEIAPNIMLNGDEASIRQIISLLLDNAIKYSSENGEICLTLKETGKNKVITVWNTVEDINIGSQDILFDRFYRADRSRNSKSGGFGIGLSVVKAIVTAHKGKISAKSDDGKSILFTIVL